MTLLTSFAVGEQYLDTGWIGVMVTLLIVAFILFNIQRAKAGRKEMFIRRIAGLNAIDDAIGRATEMGKPILMVPGIDVLDAVAVQAINIFAQVTKTAAQFGTPIRLCCADAAVYAVAQEVIRNVYQEQGMTDKFTPESVQFVAGQQFAFAAGVSGIIHREQIAAGFLLGAFYAESLIFAETLNGVGAIQVAGSTQSTQTPFFVAACDYVLIGDEFYAASAYLTREPVLVGSLVGQDWAKIMMTAMVILGVLSFSMERTQQTSFHWGVEDGGAAQIDIEGGGTEFKNRSDTLVDHLFNPRLTKEMLDVKREPKEAAAPEEAE